MLLRASAVQVQADSRPTSEGSGIDYALGFRV